MCFMGSRTRKTRSWGMFWLSLLRRDRHSNRSSQQTNQANHHVANFYQRKRLQTTTRSGNKTAISKYFLLPAQPRKKTTQRKPQRAFVCLWRRNSQESQFAVTRLHRERRRLLLDVHIGRHAKLQS